MKIRGKRNRGNTNLARLNALWPFIDPLETPRCAKLAHDSLITPNPCPRLLYMQHRGRISADHMQQSVIPRGTRGKPVCPNSVAVSPLGINPSGKAVTLPQQPVNQSVIKPSPPGRMKRLETLSPERQRASTEDETAQVLWENESLFIQSMLLFPILTLHRSLQTKAIYLRSPCP